MGFNSAFKGLRRVISQCYIHRLVPRLQNGYNARFEVLAVLLLEILLSPERVNIPENFNVPKHTDLSGVETEYRM